MSSILKDKKQKLSIMLSGAIIGLFFILSLSFVSYKYIASQNAIFTESEEIKQILTEKQEEVLSFIQAQEVERQKAFASSREDIILQNILNNIDYIWNNPQEDITDISKRNLDQTLSVQTLEEVFPFLEKNIFIFEKDKELIFQSKLGEIPFIPEELLVQNQAGESRKHLYTHIQIGEYYIVVELDKSYPASSLRSDLALILILLLGLWSILFFLSKLIVAKILKPVEENFEEMSFFLDNAGHELKTPLAVIQSSGSLMKEIGSYDPELVGEIIAETQKANELISALRELSKLSQRKNITEVSIASLLEEIGVTYQREMLAKDIRFQLPEGELIIQGNKQHLKILLTNLISNAIKYNKVGGSIQCSFRENSLIIQDTGTGIPKEDIEKIWNRFYRSKKNAGEQAGFGLGLSMVEKICRLYDYRVRVESILDLGSSFIIEF